MEIYKTLKKAEFSLNGRTIVPLREIDMADIKLWRNQQREVLRQNNELTDQDQLEYYANQVVPGFSQSQPGSMLFSYLERGLCIGYGGVTNIDWAGKSAELSFLMETRRSKDARLYRNDFITFIDLMKDVTFRELRFVRLLTETYDFRAAHIAILEDSGFILRERRKHAVTRYGRACDSLIHSFHPEAQDA
jgi:hypothetical protein